MNNDDNLDLLDLNDDTESMDTLPETSQFATPRPKKPWLLLGVGLLVIVLATYIIIRVIGGDSSSSVEIDLDAPAVVVDGENAQEVTVDTNAAPVPVNVGEGGAAPVPTKAPEVKPVAQPVTEPAPAPKVENVQANPSAPVRVVEDRKEVTFNPDKVETKKQAAKPATKPAAKKTAAKKTTPKVQTAPKGSWYVQFGSYSTRALAENAQKQIRSGHQSLFAGKQFVILAAVLPDGKTTYRLRIAFSSSGEANGFCRNAKSDGLDCYVAK